MKRLALLLFFVPGLAWACLPIASPTSSALQSIATPAGEARGSWCLLGKNTTTGQSVWAPRTHACITRLCDTRAALAALARAAAASQPSAVLDAEVLAATVKPTPGSRDEFDYLTLQHAMCAKLFESPPAGNVLIPTREQACGAPPAEPIVRWIVAKAATNAVPSGTRPAYPWVNGVRGSVSTARAAQDTPCNPAVGRVEGTTAYYGVNGRTDQVAVCVRQ
jgi:hypothetical protein